VRRTLGLQGIGPGICGLESITVMRPERFAGSISSLNFQAKNRRTQTDTGARTHKPITLPPEQFLE
jgi:hypothetical protein